MCVCICAVRFVCVPALDDLGAHPGMDVVMGARTNGTWLAREANEALGYTHDGVYCRDAC